MTRTVPVKSRRQHTRIVDDQAVAWPQIRRQVAECPIFPATLSTVQHQHARGIAFGQRLLRDPFFGQDVVELRKEHGREFSAYQSDDAPPPPESPPPKPPKPPPPPESPPP